jgi:hypothetical protein
LLTASSQLRSNNTKRIPEVLRHSNPNIPGSKVMVVLQSPTDLVRKAMEHHRQL